jgi:signal transduction histidine kinase
MMIMITLSGRVTAQSVPLDSLFKHAAQLRNDGEYNKAITAYEECLSIAQKNKDTLKTANALIGIGISNDQKGKFEDALEYYFRALSLYESINNQNKIGGTLKNIGNTYRVLTHYDKAFDFLQKALAVQTAQKDSARIANVMNDIGLVYYDQDSSKQALSYFKNILTGYDKYLTEQLKANVINNAGLAYAKLKRYNEALASYQQSLLLMEKMEDQYGIALVLGNTGDLYYLMGNYHKALDYQLRNLAIVQQIKSDELLLNSYLGLKKTYVALGDYPDAYKYQQGEIGLKDTIFHKESALNYEKMQARYQYEKGQKEILQLQHDKQIAAIELTAQQRTKYLLLTGIALALLLSVTIYRSYRLKRKANQELNLLNDKLTEANISKVKLFSIISHDLRSPVSSLFNFLQLQKLNAGRMQKGEKETIDRQIGQSAENLLEAMEDILIWSKSQMEHFKPAGESTNAGELLDEMIDLHKQFATGKQISLEKRTDSNLDFNTDINFIKIILRNLTSNAIKFTPAGGLVQLTAMRRDNHILLSVKDNGPGIKEADLKNIFEWNSIRSDSSGLGLRLAKEFTEKLKGELSVVSRPGEGTEFMVSLPL